MKKLLFISLMAGLIITASCRENELYPEDLSSVKREMLTFYTSINPFDDDDLTKTSLNSALKLCWSTNDEVAVFTGTSGMLKYKYAGTNGESEGPLWYQDGSSSGSALNYIYAIYPYKEETSITPTGVISTLYPREQTYAEGSFGQKTNIMVAVTSTGNNTFNFQNVCGYLRLDITGSSTVTAIRLKGNNNEKISGVMKITPTPSSINVDMASDATKELVLNYGAGVQLTSTPTQFYIALPPTTFSSGFTVEIFDIEGTYMTKSTSSLVNVASNHIVPMTSFLYTANAGSARAFMSGTSLGVYNLDGSALYSYTKGKDQTVVYEYPEGIDFKLLNSVDNRLVVLEGMPIDVVTGDDISPIIYSYRAEGVPTHTSANAKVLRKNGNLLYMVDEAKSLCFIVKI